MKIVKKSRSAKTGKFVSKDFAKDNPDITVTEAVKLPDNENKELPSKIAEL